VLAELSTGVHGFDAALADTRMSGEIVVARHWLAAAFRNVVGPYLAVRGRTSACPPADRPVVALRDLYWAAVLRTATCRDRGAAAEA